MKTALLALALVVLVPFAVTADDTLASFNGGIAVSTPLIAVTVTGVEPNISVTPVLNIVCGVSPGGVPWRIRNLHAVVETSGHITVEGRGLLLAGGSPTLPALNVIGTNGGQMVKAELFCNTSLSACGTAHTSGLVSLEADGDFKIDDTLSPSVPPTCTKPVLLITNGAPRWFAAGIPKK